MSKGKSKRKTGKKSQEQEVSLREPWIKPRTGLIVMIVVSVVLGGYMVWQLIPSEGFGGALLWGLGAAASIWLIAGVNYLFNRAIRRP